jgi:hypothetical protein
VGQSSTQTSIKDLLAIAARHATEYPGRIDDRRVQPSREAVAATAALGGELADAGADAAELIALLHRAGSPAHGRNRRPPILRLRFRSVTTIARGA